MRYTINIIERLGVVFLAIMISNILDLYNIAESNFAFVVIALILFISIFNINFSAKSSKVVKTIPKKALTTIHFISFSQYFL